MSFLRSLSHFWIKKFWSSRAWNWSSRHIGVWLDVTWRSNGRDEVLVTYSMSDRRLELRACQSCALYAVFGIFPKSPYQQTCWVNSIQLVLVVKWNRNLKSSPMAQETLLCLLGLSLFLRVIIAAVVVVARCHYHYHPILSYPIHDWPQRVSDCQSSTRTTHCSSLYSINTKTLSSFFEITSAKRWVIYFGLWGWQINKNIPTTFHK